MNDVLKVKPLPIDQWDDSLAFIKEDMNGRPINFHRLMAHHPELLKAWWNFRNYSVQGGELGKRTGDSACRDTYESLVRMGITC